MAWWLSVAETPVGYYVVREPRLPVVNPMCPRIRRGTTTGRLWLLFKGDVGEVPPERAANS